MTYYKSKFTGRIIASNFARCLDYVYGRETVDDMIAGGDLIILEDPSVEECIRNGGGSVAVVRYMELNPDVSWNDASQMIRQMKKDMDAQKRYNNRYSEYQTQDDE